MFAQGSASVVSGTPALILSSMTTDAICERVRQMEGIDQGIVGQYAATIRKVSRTASSNAATPQT